MPVRIPPQAENTTNNKRKDNAHTPNNVYFSTLEPKYVVTLALNFIKTSDY